MSASKTLGDFDLEASQVALLEQLEHAFQLRHRNPDEGERIGWAILDIAQARGLEHVEAVSAVVLAYCADISDAPEDGLTRLEQAVEVCGRVGDQRNIARLRLKRSRLGRTPVRRSLALAASSEQRAASWYHGRSVGYLLPSTRRRKV